MQAHAKNKVFFAENNLVTDITGICVSVQRLIMSDNFVGLRVENLLQLRQMVNLDRMELSRNGITALSAHLTTNMPHLRDFVMSGNEIQHIPQHFFKTNTKLVKI